jgi:futalosine hydrolase
VSPVYWNELIHNLQHNDHTRMPRHLILVPTEMERRSLGPFLAAAAPPGSHMALCGFGPVAAAARTAHLLAEHSPDRVLLVGIAGRLDDRLAVGAAYRFDRVACYGVGAGSGSDFVPAGRLGWHQWPGEADGTTAGRRGQIGDEIGILMSPGADTVAGGERAHFLLTVCAAAASAEDVRFRKQAFPLAAAEDMEGFAVAFACQLRGVPVDIVRGISNTAGDRNTSGWQVAAAVEAASRLALQIIQATENDS